MSTQKTRTISMNERIEQAEYGVRDTASGSAVVRGDGSYAEFLGSDEAEEAAELLASGAKVDSDYEWSEKAHD